MAESSHNRSCRQGNSQHAWPVAKRHFRVALSWLFLLLLLGGCKPTVSKRVSLWRNDKIPYGTWYAYNQLPYLFTDAYIEPWNQSPVFLDSEPDSPSAYLVIGTMVSPDEKEWQAMRNYVVSGNHLFISASSISRNILDSLRLATSHRGFFSMKDSLAVTVYDPAMEAARSFGYPGRSMDSYFTKFDSTITSVLGTNENGEPNFVKFTYEDGGSVFLHLAPLAFSNFFLLHKQNKGYYDLALSALPPKVEAVYWDDYFRHHSNGRNHGEKKGFSKLQAFLNDDILRWAFWLAVLLFALLYLFESKRRQRAVPALKQLNNTSLDFVKTIGRLYFQRRDNKNLAQKMATHFFSHVRSRYRLSTSGLDEAFIDRLSFKSGYPRQGVDRIVQSIRKLEAQASVSDEEMLEWNEQLEAFYKNT